MKPLDFEKLESPDPKLSRLIAKKAVEYQHQEAAQGRKVHTTAAVQFVVENDGDIAEAIRQAHPLLDKGKTKEAADALLTNGGNFTESPPATRAGSQGPTYRQIIDYQQSMKRLTGQELTFSEAQSRIVSAGRGIPYDEPPAGIDPAKLARMARDFQERQARAGVVVTSADAVQAVLHGRA